MTTAGASSPNNGLQRTGIAPAAEAESFAGRKARFSMKGCFLLGVVALILSIPVTGQTSSGRQASNPEDTPPPWSSGPLPIEVRLPKAYPETMAKHRVHGAEVVRLVVASSGVVLRTAVLKSLGKEADKICEQTAGSWRFAPSEEKDPRFAEVLFEFKLGTTFPAVRYLPPFKVVLETPLEPPPPSGKL